MEVAAAVQVGDMEAVEAERVAQVADMGAVVVAEAEDTAGDAAAVVTAEAVVVAVVPISTARRKSSPMPADFEVPL